MEMSEELLIDRRGPIDGQRFFSRSPFRSVWFVVNTIFALICIALTAFIVYRFGDPLNQHGLPLFSVIMLGTIARTWWATLQNIDRIRQLYAEGSVVEVEPGSPLDVAMGVAAGEMRNDLFTFFLTMVFLLAYALRLLLSCSGK